MPITDAGLDCLAATIIGAGPFVDNSKAALSIGNGTTPFAPEQTALTGASKFTKGMDVGYPTMIDNKATFRSTFLPAEANFVWNEWGIVIDKNTGILFNRAVEYNSTKLDNQTWILDVTISFVSNT